MRPEKMIKAQGQGIEIQLGEWPGQGKTLLACHGLTANLQCFQVIAAGLAGRHRLLAMDLRGRGLSGKPESGYSLEAHCGDIKGVMESLGISRLSLMGHSLGAYICLAFAAGHPDLVEKLVLLDGGAELSPEQWLKVGEGIKPSVDRLGQVLPDFAAYLALVRQAPFFNPWSRAIEDYFRYESEQVPGGVRSRVSPKAIAEERANLAQVDVGALQAKVKCPVLILRATQGMLGGDELVLPPDGLAQMLSAMPRARSVDVAGSNHFSILFQPNPERDRAIGDFLAA